ncbi:carboxypeptidase-like regulatory domain-containing protein [Sphingobacterium faecium]|uniref:carboxypeptidase-like regulatory domain-containing protein n=1 Tax=Sphingobacterium faecium TaxID=34087 RepID=UPI00097E8FA7|nr:carboxypeptidase-like regulatory domain-containing protein [Sphingobacterium faecium]WGQ14360.1 carboxypeptidase-like regulatory domain-containing protein [Sphingobacterium faecium]SJN52608.1 putative outer membrane protein, probably involved in nutrient binding [Sphingobacterium faecium PCAi_F2.5]
MKKNNRLSAIWVRSLFLGIAFSYHGLPVSAQQLHIESKSQSLKSIMQQIEKQSGYSFLYDEKTINLNRKVSLQMTGSLTQILQSLEQQTYLQLRLSGRNILINNGSVGVLTGKVTDETGLPLSLVSVFFKELNQYFLTEQDGSFRFQFPAHRLKSAEVRFSMIGRQGITLNVALDKQQTGIPIVTLPLLSVGSTKLRLALVRIKI